MLVQVSLWASTCFESGCFLIFSYFLFKIIRELERRSHLQFITDSGLDSSPGQPLGSEAETICWVYIGPQFPLGILTISHPETPAVPARPSRAKVGTDARHPSVPGITGRQPFVPSRPEDGRTGRLGSLFSGLSHTI